MKILPFQKTYLLSLSIFSLFSIVTIGALADPLESRPIQGVNSRTLTTSLKGPVDISHLKARQQQFKREIKAMKKEREEQQASEACESAHGSALNYVCEGSLLSQGAIEIMRIYQRSKTTGDMKAACKSAKKLNQFALLINGATLTTCLASLSRCVGTCNEATELSSGNKNYLKSLANDCSEKRGKYMILGGLQAGYNLMTIFTAEKCPGPPEPAPNVTTTTFPQQLARSCQGLTGRELQACQRSQPNRFTPLHIPNLPLKNRRDKSLSASAADLPSFNPEDIDLEGNLEDEQALAFSERYKGNGDSRASAVPLASTSSGGTGGGFGGGRGFGNGAGTGEDEEDEDTDPSVENLDPGIDTNILGDISNSRGASSGFGGSNQGGNKGFNFGRNPKGFKLPKNFFGDKKANKAQRNMAGIGNADPITPANGLSNFQKVSRAMNARRQTEFK